MIRSQGMIPVPAGWVDTQKVNSELAENTKKINKVPDEYDVYVIYGQSNAVGFAGNTPGRGTIPDYSLYWKERTAVGFFPLEHEMEYVQPGSANSTGHAWVEFAREYRQRTGRGLIFVPAAFGGKSISELSKGSTYYTELVDACTKLQADPNNTYTIRKWMMLFSQGENDQLNGTTRASYQQLFETLWSDIKLDTPITKCYISRVGHPQSRTQASWFEVKAAQDYLCQNLADVVMAFDGADGFTISNGLMSSDGTHYSQRGYNLMGREMAISAAECELMDLTISNDELKKYGSITINGDQMWRKVACTLYHDGTSFVLKSVDDGGIYSSSFVKSITVDTSQILLNLGGNVTDVLEYQAHINNVGLKKGLKASVTRKTDVDKLSVELFADTTAFVDTSTGAISYPPHGTGTDTGILGDLSAVIDTGITKLSYKGCDNTPVALPHTSSALSEFIKIGQKTVGSTSLWFRYETVPVNDKRAIVNFINKSIDPTKLKLTGLEINISAIVAERKR